MADFEVVFGTLETGYLQEKKLLVVFDRPWAITFIFVIWGSWGLTFGSRPSLYEFSLFLIPGPRQPEISPILDLLMFRSPLRILKIPPFTRFARPTAHLVPRS